MLGLTEKLIFWIIMFVVWGFVWYIVDRTYCSSLYRWWYGMTHKDELPAGESRGFIYRSSVKGRVSASSIISTAQSFLGLYFGADINPLQELVLWFFEIPAMMVGFYLGPVAFHLWSRRDEMLSKLDDIEKRGLNMDIGGKVEKAAASFEDGAHKARSKIEQTSNGWLVSFFVFLKKLQKSMMSK